MNPHAEMTSATAETVRVVCQVNTDQLADPTPCQDWDVRALVNHIILWTAYSAEQRAHGGSVDEELMRRDFAAEPGFADDYAAQAGKAVAAWSDPAAWERKLDVMGSATSAADVAELLIAEAALHGWDLATATGLEHRCDDATAAVVLRVVAAQGELFRQYKGFADVVPVPDDAPAFTRALALSGRDPAQPRP
jgi:uncharacterized protein (TIGR03086 family)